MKALRDLSRPVVTVLVLVLAACASAAPPEQARIDPAPSPSLAFDSRTWVYAVGVLEYERTQDWASFPKKGRRDAELVQQWELMGVPAGQILFLREEQATLSAMRSGLEGVFKRMGEGDELLLYYAGHGDKDEAGETYLIPYDCGDEFADSALSMSELRDRIEAGFRGSRLLVLVDCCYSGALVEKLDGLSHSGFSTVVLTSSLPDASSTESWTFTEGLLAGLRGEGVCDGDGDGRILMEEWAGFVQSELAFADDQLSSAAFFGEFAPGDTLGPAGPRAFSRQGEHLEVLSEEQWHRARVVAARGDLLLVHFYGWGDEFDEWVGPERCRVPKRVEYEPGAEVQVRWRRKWYPATVLEQRHGLHRVRYEGRAGTRDEWVARKRLRQE